MTVQLTGELIDDLKTYLAANLPTFVDAVNTAFGDDITLGDFDSVRVDDPDSGVRVQMVNATLHVVATVGSIGTWGNGYAMPTQDVVFWVTARDQDKQVLRRKLYRYLLVVWNTLVAGHFDSSIAWNMGIEVDPEFDYSETFTRENVMYADARLAIKFQAMES